jgi:hypothetical protein
MNLALDSSCADYRVPTDSIHLRSYVIIAQAMGDEKCYFLVGHYNTLIQKAYALNGTFLKNWSLPSNLINKKNIGRLF